MFAQTVALAHEIEGAARAAKATAYGEGVSDIGAPVLKVDGEKPKRRKPPIPKGVCM